MAIPLPNNILSWGLFGIRRYELGWVCGVSYFIWYMQARYCTNRYCRLISMNWTTRMTSEPKFHHNNLLSMFSNYYSSTGSK
jgi:hypothetical protein